MTFCLGMRVEEGLVAIADTRITSGTEVTIARKLSIYQHDNHSMFLMTSGLRSVRDKALTYFEEIIESQDEKFDKLYKAVNAFGDAIRQVAKEDKPSIEEAGLHFNLHCLVGGQLERDNEHKLYLLYPQGNWIEVGVGTPYYIIGESGYGKPIIRRTLQYTDSMRHALKVGVLAFDSTRISATDVDYPLDVVLYQRDTFQMVEQRFDAADLDELTNFWQERLRTGVAQLPADGLTDMFNRLPSPKPRSNSPAPNTPMRSAQ